MVPVVSLRSERPRAVKSVSASRNCGKKGRMFSAQPRLESQGLTSCGRFENRVEGFEAGIQSKSGGGREGEGRRSSEREKERARWGRDGRNRERP